MRASIHERPGKRGGALMDIIRTLEQEQIRTDLPVLSIGDHVRVHLKVKEGNREDPGLRRNCYCKERLRSQRNLHGKKSVLWCRR